MARYSAHRNNLEPRQQQCPSQKQKMYKDPVRMISFHLHSTAGTSQYWDGANITVEQVCACTGDTRKHYPLLGKARRKNQYQNFDNKDT